MNSRALILALSLVSNLYAAHANATAREWDFTAYLGDNEIGYHRFALTQSGPERELLSEARFNVKFLFIDAYRYAHEARERWRGDCLARIDTTTDDNGKTYRVRGALIASGLRVDTDATQTLLPPCVMSFAYWNPDFLKQTRLLNAQNGEYLDVRVQALGSDTIAVRGQVTPARRYRLSARDLDIELWYSPTGDWLALDSITADGKRLRYRL